MGNFLNELKQEINYTLTENGAITHRSTLSGLLDLFTLGGSYRKRTDDDCITLFKQAFDEDETYAMKCLFYLRDVRGGQGERRFFRVICKWLASEHTEAMRRNLKNVPEYGRWDDLYCFVDTPLHKEAFRIMYHQLALDVECKTPSLLAKWLKSENTSSPESRKLATITRTEFKMTPRQYRKTLSTLRKRINIVERLMSEGRWDEIEFDKIPSRAGIIYRNAFARRDLIKEKYATFAKDKNTKVNAETLYPYDIAHRAYQIAWQTNWDDPKRLMLQKYWDNLPNYYGDRTENGIAVIDTSGSMMGQPLEVAVSLGAYIADKAKGPFKNHFITFSSTPSLVEFTGTDITDKFRNARRANWNMNTNLQAVFRLLLTTARKNHTPSEDMPERIYIISDMEFDAGINLEDTINDWDAFFRSRKAPPTINSVNTLMESVAQEWANYGYKLPSVVFWNVDARNNNIPAIGDGFSYISGFSPIMLKQILSGKDGLSLCLDKLNSERYKPVC